MTENNKTKCKVISEMLVDYINRRLTQSENSVVIKHLANCKECREEVALLFDFKKMAQDSMKEIPQEAKMTAFAKIPKDKKELDEIINSCSIFMPFELINHFLLPVKQTLRLVKQVI